MAATNAISGAVAHTAAVAAMMTDVADGSTVDAITIIRLLLEDAHRQRQELLQARCPCQCGTETGNTLPTPSDTASAGIKLDTLELFAGRCEGVLAQYISRMLIPALTGCNLRREFLANNMRKCLSP